ncbi:hypothetical protein OG302_42465 [Streptomyces sp. NBC_01283]|uniref:hypothetical protein n=1 Tax=Streptomyces sp. NBC_01283 TaxID=2903812 RepID=UPI00352FC68B|nr:hypothetical protein OG302_00015 [Streptomyces sp. NBC_01283]WSL21430.1 hypothetical protein OG302_42465 [Streptomyces sp. NBC_01283]
MLIIEVLDTDVATTMLVLDDVQRAGELQQLGELFRQRDGIQDRAEPTPGERGPRTVSCPLL